MGPLGVQEIILIFVLALVLFGPKKLPELGRMLGRAVSEFRKAKNELRSTWESHMAEIERESQIPSALTETAEEHSPAEYPYSYDDYDRYEGEEAYEAELETAPMETPEAPSHADKAEAGSGHAVATAHSGVAGSGTVSHVNGTSPGGSAPIPAKEEHPAA